MQFLIAKAADETEVAGVVVLAEPVPVKRHDLRVIARAGGDEIEKIGGISLDQVLFCVREGAECIAGFVREGDFHDHMARLRVVRVLRGEIKT